MQHKMRGELALMPPPQRPVDLHSAKGGAVETGCSDLYGVVHDLTI